MATRTQFSKQLDEVQDLVIRFGEKTASDVRAAGLATQFDKGAASGIVEGRKATDRLRSELESTCLDIMLLQQPLVGEDLRLVSGAFRLVSDLYHADTMTSDIAFILGELPKKVVKHLGDTYVDMAERTALMIEEATKAFADTDAELAHKVIDSDDEIDKLYSGAQDMIVSYIRNGKSVSKALPELLMIAKYFERIGDQAQRVAAWAIFRATGERVLASDLDGSDEGDEEEE